MSRRGQQSQSSLGYLFGGGTSQAAGKSASTSSNAFATGSNQNAGNVMTGRSSTRVHAPPGGRSQISIGGGYGDSSASTGRASAAGGRRAAPSSTASAGRGTSANAFASGSNQNAGNFITDRSTTRIHAPPGGRSQISFGSYDSSSSKPATSNTSKATAAPTRTAAKQGTSSNRFATGSNQNAGNVITDRSSTRIHAPPGGRSQISFGSYDSSSSKPLTQTSRTNIPSVTGSTKAATKRGTSSNRFATGSNQNAGNVITDRSSTRIHAPPGGHSQVMFG